MNEVRMHLDFSARVLSTMASVDPFTSSHGSRVAGTICHRQEYSTQKVKEICEPHIAEQTGITVRSMCRGRAKRRSVVLRGRSEIRRTHDWVTSISTVQFAGAGSTHTWQLRSPIRLQSQFSGLQLRCCQLLRNVVSRFEVHFVRCLPLGDHIRSSLLQPTPSGSNVERHVEWPGRGRQLFVSVLGDDGRTASAHGSCLTYQKCHVRLVLPKVKSATDRWSDENSHSQTPECCGKQHG